MMEAVRTSEPSVENHFTRQYNPEDNSEQAYITFHDKSEGHNIVDMISEM
jgi:hypothetical protein